MTLEYNEFTEEELVVRIFNTLRKVQKILRNATVSENTFQSFNMEGYEKFF